MKTASIPAALWPTLLTLAAAAAVHGAPTANPAPAAPVQLPTYEVNETKNRRLNPGNPLFDHAFADLRSGAMIEAILWRHHYLEDHAQEEAVIFTTHSGDRVVSATTVYTREGKVYGSSNALGESLLIKGVVPADLHRAEGAAQIKKFLAATRTALGDAIRSANGVSAEDANDAVNLMVVTPESAPALELLLAGGSSLDLPPQAGFAKVGGRAAAGLDSVYQTINSQYLAAVTAAAAANPTGTPGMGTLLVTAEETGDYRVLGNMAGPPSTVDVATLRKVRVPEQTISQMIVQKLEDNLRNRRAFTFKFSAPSDEVLTLTYQALRDSKRAGLLPVALAPLGGPGSTVTVPAYAKAAKAAAHPQTCLILDWEGVQYYYQPDLGTWSKPLPLNAITGKPYLCLKNGALMECAYFCATYALQHPDAKVQLVPGEPVMAAYQAGDKLHIFSPALGNLTLGKEYLEALGDDAYLGKIREQIAAMPKPAGQAADAIPEEMPGDDGDLQMRRAFLAFKAAGLRCHLDESGPPSLAFTWGGTDYAYGSDQQVHVIEQ